MIVDGGGQRLFLHLLVFHGDMVLIIIMTSCISSCVHGPFFGCSKQHCQIMMMIFLDGGHNIIYRSIYIYIYRRRRLSSFFLGVVCPPIILFIIQMVQNINTHSKKYIEHRTKKTKTRFLASKQKSQHDDRYLFWQASKNRNTIAVSCKPIFFFYLVLRIGYDPT